MVDIYIVGFAAVVGLLLILIAWLVREIRFAGREAKQNWINRRINGKPAPPLPPRKPPRKAQARNGNNRRR